MAPLIRNIFTMANSVHLANENSELQLLQALVENSFDSILITDASRDGKIIYANKAFKTLTGFDPVAVVGKTPRILQGPATDQKVIARLATAVASRWGALDILVINAAIMPQLTPVGDIDPAAFTKALTVNVLATQTLIARFDACLRKSAGARVIGLTSNVATAPRAFWGAYASAKAAAEVLLDCYAQEVRNISKVRVAIVNPSATRTKMRAAAYPGEDPASVKAPEVVANRLVALLGEDFPSPYRETLGK